MGKWVCKQGLGTPGYYSPEVFAAQCSAKDRLYTFPHWDGVWDEKANDVWTMGVVIWSIAVFEMPCNKLWIKDAAFNALTSGSYLPEYKRKPKRHNLKARIRASKKEWAISESLCDLLKKIFVPEKQRITMDGIFEHPWIQNALEENF